jgi:transcriptional/translational regulatory protein YebC/TACO1
MTTFNPLDAVETIIKTINAANEEAADMARSARAISDIREIFENRKLLGVSLSIRYRAKSGVTTYEKKIPIPGDLLDRLIETVIDHHRQEIERGYAETKRILREITDE